MRKEQVMSKEQFHSQHHVNVEEVNQKGLLSLEVWDLLSGQKKLFLVGRSEEKLMDEMYFQLNVANYTPVYAKPKEKEFRHKG